LHIAARFYQYLAMRHTWCIGFFFQHPNFVTLNYEKLYWLSYFASIKNLIPCSDPHLNLNVRKLTMYVYLSTFLAHWFLRKFWKIFLYTFLSKTWICTKERSCHMNSNFLNLAFLEINIFLYNTCIDLKYIYIHM
jgi:hypothetical protein